MLTSLWILMTNNDFSVLPYISPKCLIQTTMLFGCYLDLAGYTHDELDLIPFSGNLSFIGWYMRCNQKYFFGHKTKYIELQEIWDTDFSEPELSLIIIDAGCSGCLASMSPSIEFIAITVNVAQLFQSNESTYSAIDRQAFHVKPGFMNDQVKIQTAGSFASLFFEPVSNSALV